LYIDDLLLLNNARKEDFRDVSPVAWN
jgi:hypothetical protein